MSVRPLDMTLVVQRTPEANRAQANESQHPEVAQQMFSEKLNKETQLRDRQVVQTNKTEENRVDRDGKQGGGGGYSPRKKGKEKKEHKAAVPQTGGESMFDISI